MLLCGGGSGDDVIKGWQDDVTGRDHRRVSGPVVVVYFNFLHSQHCEDGFTGDAAKDGVLPCELVRPLCGDEELAAVAGVALSGIRAGY